LIFKKRYKIRLYIKTMTIQEVAACIDRSGSMSGKESDTIGGINVAINELKSSKAEGDTVRISINLFDHEQIMLLRHVDVTQYSDLPISAFVPRGQTALLDAIGDTLAYFMEKKLMNPSAYDCCTIYIATDGLENASKRYSRGKIAKMISTAKTTYNIEVLYLGANQDAILEAGSIGISADHAINYAETQDNVEAVYRNVSRVASSQREHGSARGFTAVERHSSAPPQVSAPLQLIPHPTTPPPIDSARGNSPPPLRRSYRNGSM